MKPFTTKLKKLSLSERWLNQKPFPSPPVKEQAEEKKEHEVIVIDD